MSLTGYLESSLGTFRLFVSSKTLIISYCRCCDRFTDIMRLASSKTISILVSLFLNRSHHPSVTLINQFTLINQLILINQMAPRRC